MSRSTEGMTVLSPILDVRGKIACALLASDTTGSALHIQCPAVVGRTLRVMSWFGLVLARQTEFMKRQNFPIPAAVNKLRNDAACDRRDHHLSQCDTGFCLDLKWVCNHKHTMELSSCLLVFITRFRFTGLYYCAREQFRNMQPVT